MQETRKLDDELFPAERFTSALKPVNQPEPTEGSAPPSPRTGFDGNGQAEPSDGLSEYDEPTRTMDLDDSNSPLPPVSPTQSHPDSDINTPPPAIDPRERLQAALDLEPRKVSNAPLTRMPDREEYITWERELKVSMEQMFTDIMARGNNKTKEGADDAIVKRTHLQMLCLPNARPQHIEALAAVFQRERQSTLALSKPESMANDASTGMCILRAISHLALMSRHRCPKK